MVPRALSSLAGGRLCVISYLYPVRCRPNTAIFTNFLQIPSPSRAIYSNPQTTILPLWGSPFSFSLFRWKKAGERTKERYYPVSRPAEGCWMGIGFGYTGLGKTGCCYLNRMQLGIYYAGSWKIRIIVGKEYAETVRKHCLV